MIKSEILITVGMGWPVSSDQWKAPSVVRAREPTSSWRENVILTATTNNNFYLNTVKIMASTAYLAYGTIAHFCVLKPLTFKMRPSTQPAL